MKQLVEPNLLAKGQVGWCLSYVHDVFDTPVVYPSAWLAWEGTQFKHTDALPEDVAVPVFFSYNATINGVYANWGHVVVYVPGKGFYSSPWKQSQSFAVLSSIEEVERIYGCKYVGWSEDVNNIRVAGDDMELVDINTLRILHSEVLGWDLDEVHSGKYDESLKAVYGHLTANQATLQIFMLKDADSYRKSKKAAFIQAALVPSLQAKVDETAKALALYQASNGELTKWLAVKQLLKQIIPFLS